VMFMSTSVAVLCRQRFPAEQAAESEHCNSTPE